MTVYVPKEILFDNMKNVVDITKDGRKINIKLKAFADDFGFKITLCKLRHSYTKWKVEINLQNGYYLMMGNLKMNQTSLKCFKK